MVSIEGYTCTEGCTFQEGTESYPGGRKEHETSGKRIKLVRGESDLGSTLFVGPAV